MERIKMICETFKNIKECIFGNSSIKFTLWGNDQMVRRWKDIIKECHKLLCDIEVWCYLHKLRIYHLLTQVKLQNYKLRQIKSRLLLLIGWKG